MLWLILPVVFFTWIINGGIGLSKAESLCDDYRNRREFGHVDEIFDYYHPIGVKGWFGFRHWFYDYEPTTKEK